MQKGLFVFQEFFRSVRKSLFRDILLMVILAMGCVASVLMVSYYFNAGERYSKIASYYSEDGEWYDCSFPSDEEAEFYENLSTKLGCINILKYYQDIRGMENYKTLSIHTAQPVEMEEKDAKEMFGGLDYSEFADTDHPMPVSGMIEGKIHSLQIMKGMQLDDTAFEVYGLQTVMGEGFTPENTVIANADAPIPVVLGYHYKDTAKPGDELKITIAGTEHFFSCVVSGILESGSEISGFGDISQENINMDSYIIFPYGIVLEQMPDEYDELNKYAYLSYVSLFNTKVLLHDRSEFATVMEQFQILAEPYHIPAIQVNDISMGLNLLRKESAETVRAIFFLAVGVLVFLLFSLFVTLYDKIQINLQNYGIYLMLGCSRTMILSSYILELIFIFLPSVIVCNLVFTNQNVGWSANIFAVMREAYLLLGMIFMVSVLILCMLFRKVSIENLIRTKE